ncbi:MAG: BrnT family toxin [Hyphomicrobium sp.]|nr:BrnT family toxin [Hyphomicrobium sp.]
MKFEWDPAKAAANIAKHGVSFEQAEAAFTDPKAMELLDESSQGEERWRLLGRAESGVLMVVYTERRDYVRIISARRADAREQKAYLGQD